MIFGLGQTSKYVMVAIGIFYPLAINAAAGVIGIQRIYFDVAWTCHARGWRTFRTVALPGAMPLIVTGLKLGIGLGLVLNLGRDGRVTSGLGYMIWNAWQIFDVEAMYVGLSVTGVLGVLLSILLNAVERYLVPWRSD